MKRFSIVSSLVLFILVHEVASYEPVRIDARIVVPDRRSIGPRVSDGTVDRYEQHVVTVYVPSASNEQEATRIAQENGFVVKHSLRGPVLQNYYLFERDDALRDLPHSLEEDGRIEWWEDATGIPRTKRDGVERHKRPHPPREEQDTWMEPTDPLFGYQWHLGPSFNVDANHPHLNVINVWKQGITGHGVTLAVVDDGLQTYHPDLEENYYEDASWDFNENNQDPSPKHGDSHGTSASGVAGADRDTHCGVGVAYSVNLAGIRLLGGWETDAIEAEALSHQCINGIDIYSCSWGPTDDGKHLDGPGRVVSHALSSCSKRGRGGKGSIYVWAGGNGKSHGDNSNYDGFANSIYTISVPAVDERGITSWYSEPGANHICTAPSSGTRVRIVTTDLKGRPGDSPNDCTFEFGGTSASAPQIAGVCALLLQANPDLTWRDVQHIFALTSAKIRDGHRTENDKFVRNAAGLTHSHDLGFGLADASAAVSMAQEMQQEHSHLGEQLHFSTGTLQSPVDHIEPQHSILLYWEPDNVVEAEQAIPVLEHVTLYVDLDVPSRSRCLALALIGPSGMNSTLSAHSDGLETRVKWTYMSVRHWGEPLVYKPEEDVRSVEEKRDAHVNVQNPSRWSMRLHNLCSRADGEDITINEWKIDFYGHA